MRWFYMLFVALLAGVGLYAIRSPAPEQVKTIPVNNIALKLHYGDHFELLQLAATDAQEGPVCVPQQNRLYFTSAMDAKDLHIAIRYLNLLNNKVHTFKERSNMASGMALSRDKQYLWVAEQGTKTVASGIAKINLKTGKRKRVISQYDKKPLNAPNDLVESKSGWIYFTDPRFAYEEGFRPLPYLKEGVYAFYPKTKKLYLMSDAFVRPNGVALSPDDKILYVSEMTDVKAVSAYNPMDHHPINQHFLDPGDVKQTFKVADMRPGTPDGLATDEYGFLYVTAGNGVQIFNRNGELAMLIPIPKGAISLTLCDYKQQRLMYITTGNAIYRVLMR